MGAKALLVVPPLLKVTAGPVLGPAMLVAAGREAGHEVNLIDLNRNWIDGRMPTSLRGELSAFLGDHDRPGSLLRTVEQDFLTAELAAAAGYSVNAIARMQMSHEEAIEAARRIAASRFGQWLRASLGTREVPQVVGVSIMYSGQVLAGLAVSAVARELWPAALIVWGGAHVTALGTSIADDAGYGTLVGRFVCGYAERTWCQILDAVDRATSLPPEAMKAGAGTVHRALEDMSVVPVFEDLDGRANNRLTVPTQSSRGCAYGRCAFCTYPGVEGRARLVPIEVVLAAVELAERHGGVLSFKDSLVTVPRLEELADLIAGRVQWSACTKLNARLDGAFLRRIADAGCRTLEVGLETITAHGQSLVHKRQDLSLFLQFIDAAASAGIAVVVNYITGFPGANDAEEQRGLEQVLEALARTHGLVAKLEHNRFELERASPMGIDPAAYGMRVTATWPWATVMQWERDPAATRRRPGRLLALAP